MENLFERYGGVPFVSRLVFAFYDRVLDHEELAPFFARYDMRRLVEHQTKFLSSVATERPSHSNEQLREVHAELRIGPEAFQTMLDLMEETLSEFGVDRADRALLVRELEARRPYIVTLPARSSVSA